MEASAQGFYDFGEIPGVADEAKVQIDLGPAMIGFLTTMTRETDPATADLLAGLQGVRLRVYEALRDGEAVTEFIDDVSRELEADGWESMVKVQDGGANVRVYLQFLEERIEGMTVMVVDDSEAVFINIAGSFDPAQLGRIATQVGLSGMLDGIAATNFAMPVAPAPAPQQQPGQSAGAP
jgi:hypothetical protein